MDGGVGVSAVFIWTWISQIAARLHPFVAHRSLRMSLLPTISSVGVQRLGDDQRDDAALRHTEPQESSGIAVGFDHQPDLDHGERRAGAEATGGEPDPRPRRSGNHFTAHASRDHLGAQGMRQSHPCTFVGRSEISPQCNAPHAILAPRESAYVELPKPKYTIGRDPLHAASFNFPAGMRGSARSVTGICDSFVVM